MPTRKLFLRSESGVSKKVKVVQKKQEGVAGKYICEKEAKCRPENCSLEWEGGDKQLVEEGEKEDILHLRLKVMRKNLKTSESGDKD